MSSRVILCVLQVYRHCVSTASPVGLHGSPRQTRHYSGLDPRLRFQYTRTLHAGKFFILGKIQCHQTGMLMIGLSKHITPPL